MKSYLRFLSRNKLYTAIMMVGLSLAMTFVIIFTCYVKQQIAVNTHYPDSDNIYLVGVDQQTYSYYYMAEDLEAEIPEIEEAVHIEYYYNSYKYEGEVLSKEGLLEVGKDFFELFQIKFLYGSPEDFDVKENAFVTEGFAREHGMEEVIGKKLTNGKRTFIIAGIIEDFSNTVFKDYEFVINYKAFAPVPEDRRSSGGSVMTFIKAADGTDIGLLEEKVSKVAREFYKRNQYPREKKAMLIRLDKLYFADANNGRFGLKTESREKLMIFSLVVLFLLISAIINYVNLNIANAETRAKEVAVRHIMGAERRLLTFRTLLESFAFTSVTFIIALAAAALLIDPINGLLQSVIPISISFGWDYIGIYCMLIMLIAVICGVAVSTTTSGIRITSSTRTKKPISNMLMAIQFVISLIMISVAVTMEMQMKHMIEREMYANVDNIYSTNVAPSGLKEKIEALPFVRSIGKSTGYPGYFGMYMKQTDDNPAIGLMYCDSTAFKIFGFEKVDDFNPGNLIGTWMSESTARHYGIGEGNTTLKSSGFDDLIYDENVTGIIKDSPTANVLEKQYFGLGIISVTSPENVSWGGLILETDETPEHKHILDSLVNTMYKNETGRDAYGYGFLKDLHKSAYDRTRKDMRLTELFMFIAILLSCLAFLAMSMHYATSNTIQISIHKVFGGTTESEVLRCLWGYMKIMIYGTIIGLPMAIWVCGRYLQQFSYRFTLTEKWWIFPLAIAISLLVSTTAILWQTIRAARTNPAEALKKE